MERDPPPSAPRSRTRNQRTPHPPPQPLPLQRQQPPYCRPPRRRHLLLQLLRRLPTKHQHRRPPHRLRSHGLRLGAPQPQRHGAVDKGFEEEGEEGGGAAAKGGAGVELGGGDVGYGADGCEEVVDEAEDGGCGGWGGGDDGCGGADEAGGVGHRADDDGRRCGFPISVFLARERGAVGFGGAQDCFDLRDRDAGEDADEELASEGFLYGGDPEARVQILRLAAEENGVGGLDGADVLALKDGDWDWVGEPCQLFLQPLHGFGATHAGDVVGGFAAQLFAFGR